MYTGRQNIKFSILMLFLCFSIITGCTVLQGKTVKTYESEYQDAVQASSDTLKTLRIPVIETMSDELKTVIHAERFDGTPVSIEVVRIDRNHTEVSVRTGTGVIPDNKVPMQIHEFISDSLEQQSKEGAKDTENIEKEGIQAASEETTPQGITEENLEEYSAPEITAAEPATDYSDQKQSEQSPKLAGIYTDSVFVIFFNQDSNALTPKSMQKLDRVAEIVLRNKKIGIILNGYTDSYGAPSYNKIVSESRANTVKLYLIGKGVAPARITTVGHGAQKFLASNRTREGRRFNRRVEIELKNQRTE